MEILFLFFSFFLTKFSHVILEVREKRLHVHKKTKRCACNGGAHVHENEARVLGRGCLCTCTWKDIHDAFFCLVLHEEDGFYTWRDAPHIHKENISMHKVYTWKLRCWRTWRGILVYTARENTLLSRKWVAPFTSKGARVDTEKKVPSK